MNIRFLKSRKLRLSLLILIFLFCGLVTKIRLDSHLATRYEEDIRYLPTPSTANVLAFGFKPALADLYWIMAINYFGEQLSVKHRTFKYLKSYTDLTLNLDPYFTYFYDWAGTVFIYNTLPLSRENLITSTEYLNYGIHKLHEIHRYDRNTIVKAAFNFALETNKRKPSIPYFELAARTFPTERTMFIVASSYAYSENDFALASKLKLEYLGQLAFEAQNKEEIKYALQILSSARTNIAANDFVKALRVKMESNEDIRKIVEKKLQDNAISKFQLPTDTLLPPDPRIENVLNIELSKTWMPTEMLVLFSL